jgi:hypothetical protein
LLAERLLKKEYLNRKRKGRHSRNKKRPTHIVQTKPIHLKKPLEDNNGDLFSNKRKPSTNPNSSSNPGNDFKLKRNVLVKQEEANELEEEEEEEEESVQKLRNGADEITVLRNTLAPIIAVQEASNQKNLVDPSTNTQVVSLTNIMEDEKPEEENDDVSSSLLVGQAVPTSANPIQQQQISSRRCSRGGIMDNQLTSLTILEEVSKQV